MIIASYHTLNDSAILFWIRKQIQAESGKEEIKKRLEKLEKTKIELQNEKIGIDNQFNLSDKKHKEVLETKTIKRENEANFLKVQNDNLEKFLKNQDIKPY